MPPFQGGLGGPASPVGLCESGCGGPSVPVVVVCMAQGDFFIERGIGTWNSHESALSLGATQPDTDPVDGLIGEEYVRSVTRCLPREGLRICCACHWGCAHRAGWVECRGSELSSQAVCGLQAV